MSKISRDCNVIIHNYIWHIREYITQNKYCSVWKNSRRWGIQWLKCMFILCWGDLEEQWNDGWSQYRIVFKLLDISFMLRSSPYSHLNKTQKCENSNCGDLKNWLLIWSRTFVKYFPVSDGRLQYVPGTHCVMTVKQSHDPTWKKVQVAFVLLETQQPKHSSRLFQKLSTCWDK